MYNIPYLHKEKQILHKFITLFFLILLSPVFLYSLSDTPQDQVKFLNTKEVLWLEKREKPLRIGITQIPNQILKHDNNYSGYSIDLFKKLEILLDTKFKYIYFNTWDEVLEAGKNRDIDIIFFAQKTEKRLNYYNFTDTVLLQHNKIITTSKNNVSINVTQLNEKKVAVVSGSAIASYIKLNFPYIKLVESDNEADSLHKLLSGEVEYIIAEPVRVSFYIKEKNIDDLYIAGNFPYDYKLRIATRNDIPIINIILNKALEVMNPSEKKALALKWGYEKEVLVDSQLLFKIAVVGFILLFFLTYMTILNKKLRKTQNQLRKVNETLEQRVQEEVAKNREKELIMLQQSRFVQMGQVIHMITHQWRQPLNTLSLITQVMFLKCKKNELTEDELENFKVKTTQQIHQMSQTIDDFRDFFKQQKEKTIFSLNDTIQSLLRIVQPIFETSSIELVVLKMENIKVEGYPNELTQAILNILYNAKDALLERDVKNKKVELSLYRENNHIIISIKDNAGGIDEAVIDNIFDASFSTKGKKGTGIGLHMTKIIIEQHMHGRVIAYNEDDGAVFKIILT